MLLHTQYSELLKVGKKSSFSHFLWLFFNTFINCGDSNGSRSSHIKKLSPDVRKKAENKARFIQLPCSNAPSTIMYDPFLCCDEEMKEQANL